jgi:hypothetical protein
MSIPSVSYAVPGLVEELMMTIHRGVLLEQNKLDALWPCKNPQCRKTHIIINHNTKT